MAQGDSFEEAPLPSVAAAQDTIEVFVGSNHKRYILHKALLMHHSGYFRGALSGNWVEAENASIALEHVHTGPFNVFVNWIYRGKTPPGWASVEWLDDGESKEQFTSQSWERVLNLGISRAYVLADMLIVPEFKRDLFNERLTTLCICPPTKEIVVHSYANLPEGDPLLQLLVDAYCFVFLRNLVTWKPQEGFPYEFLARVVARLSGPDRSRIPTREDYTLE